jgi:hypothetical protein
MVVGFNSSSTTNYNPHEDSEWLPGMGTRATVSGLSADNVKASVKWLPLLKSTSAQVLDLNVTASTSGTYTFERTDFKEIPSIYNVWLVDSYKKDSLDIRHNTTYAFNVDLSDTNSYGHKRFHLVVREDPGMALHLLKFGGTKETNGSEIVWTTENEENYTNFTVERSTDGGASFSVIGGMSSSSLGTYSLLDARPVTGADVYRLKLEDLNGTVTYSNNITLMYGALSNTLVSSAVSIYPNPTKSAINLSIVQGLNASSTLAQSSLNTKAATNVVYAIKIVNNTGSVIKSVTTSQSNWQTDVSYLLPGTYVVEVINNSDKSVVGRGTFVKL